MKLFNENVMPNMGQLHLDFGCGNGLGTTLEAIKNPRSTIIGYDTDAASIRGAQDILRKSRLTNLFFTDSKSELRPMFNSAGANFVYHEAQGIFKEIHPLLLENGTICVLDYNLKGLSKRDFKKNFCFDNEIKILQQEGLDECYRKHTARGSQECARDVENTGFKIKELNLRENYFALIATKN
jgi:hypothetical protein